MKLVDKPFALPGSCFKCGSGSRDFYIDTEIHMEFHGRLYLCNICVEEIMSLVGALSVPVSKALKVQLEDAAREVYELGSKNAGLERAVTELTLVRSIGGVSSVALTHGEASLLTGGEIDNEYSGPLEQVDDEDVAGLHSADPFAKLRTRG